MNQLWQFWSGVLNDQFIEHIINTGMKFPAVDASIGFDGSTNKEGYRSSTNRWIPVNADKAISETLWWYGKEANKNAFGFYIDDLVDIQFTEYHAVNNGKYDWHHDTFWGNPTTYDRKISIVIQLSDPKDYEGGDFQLDSQYEQPNPESIKKKGSVIVFPSFIPHRVTPVTKGTRRSLVTWIQGPKFR